MKKAKYFILICTIVLLNGCVKSTTTMEIKNDKSVSYEAKLLFASSLLNGQSINPEDYEYRGITAKKVVEDKYEGVILTKSFSNIDDISSNEDKKIAISDFTEKDFDDSVLFKLEKGFLKNKYTATYTYTADDYSDYSNDETQNNVQDNTESDGNNISLNDDNITGEENNASSDLDYSVLLSEMEYKFIVKLPNKSLSNNATNVSEDGKELTWNLLSSGSNDINYTFELWNMNNIYIVGAVIILVIIIIIGIIISVSKKHKKENDLIPTEAPIHTDFDPSINSELNEGENININDINSINNSLENNFNTNPSNNINDNNIESEFIKSQAPVVEIKDEE